MATFNHVNESESNIFDASNVMMVDMKHVGDHWRHVRDCPVARKDSLALWSFREALTEIRRSHADDSQRGPCLGFHAALVSKLREAGAGAT